MKPNLFFNGENSDIHHVSLSVVHDVLIIKSSQSALTVSWAIEDMILKEMGNLKKDRPFLFSSRETPYARLHCFDLDIANELIGRMHRSQKEEWININYKVVFTLLILATLFLIGLFRGWPLFAEKAAPYLPQTITDYLQAELEEDILSPYLMCEDDSIKKHLKAIIKDLKIKGFEKDDDFEIVVINHYNKVNAFVLPGRKIYVYTKLLKQANSVDEIANVLAHEIGHLHHFHTNEAIIRELGIRTSIQLIVLGIGGGETISKLGALMNSLSYSRENEREADAFMINVIQKSPYSLNGAVDFFSKHLPKKGKNDYSIAWAAEYLSTHPTSKERIEHFKTFTIKPYFEQDSERLKAIKKGCKPLPVGKQPIERNDEKEKQTNKK